MPKPAIAFDNRPRYGWCSSLDSDPQIIWDVKPKGYTKNEYRPVVVIPLPNASEKLQLKIKYSVLEAIWPKK